MLKVSLVAAVALAAGIGFAPPAAEAATCKEPIAAKSRSAAQGSDKYREGRARDNAIKHWRTKARQQYGFAYRFWSRATDRKVECTGTAKSRQCVVTATPCSLL